MQQTLVSGILKKVAAVEKKMHIPGVRIQDQPIVVIMNDVSISPLLLKEGGAGGNGDDMSDGSNSIDDIGSAFDRNK